MRILKNLLKVIIAEVVLQPGGIHALGWRMRDEFLQRIGGAAQCRQRRRGGSVACVAGVLLFLILFINFIDT